MLARKTAKDEESERDKINGLPDEILQCILSYLPIKYAVATSILSKRWRFLWTSVSKLEFDDTILFSTPSEGVEIRFVNFVERVLCYHSDVCSVKKISLRCWGSYLVPGILRILYATTVMPNLEELDLDFCIRGTVQLPNCIYNSFEKLHVLKLCGGITLNVPQSVYFSKLQSLQLNSVTFTDDDGLKKLLRGCPVLRDLCINQETWPISKSFIHVCSSSLKNLKISRILHYGVMRRARVVLETPNLEKLKLVYHTEVYISVVDLSSLVSASIDVKEPYKTSYLIRFLKKISHVKKLELSSNTVKMLETSGYKELPVFHNLTHLKLGNSKVARLVPKLLELSPNLVSFKLEKV